MTLEILSPEGVGAPIAHYALATRTEQRIYLAGLVPLDQTGAVVGRGSAREQMEHVCNTLRTICSQYGAGLENVAQCLLFISHRTHYVEVDAAFAEAFKEHRPARAAVVAELVHEDFLVELTNVVIEL